MYLAYLDESGDPGLVNSPTNWFVLSCVLIHESNWLDTLNKLVDLRRSLKSSHGIPTRKEIKAQHLKSGRGVFTGLGWSIGQRMDLYRDLLEFQDNTISCKVFAVAIHKVNAFSKGFHPLRACWQFTLERIQRFCQEEKDFAMILNDEGNSAFIQRTLRFMRRHNYVATHFPSAKKSLAFTVTNIVEDPVEKHSDHSYFIQLADWNAYAAHRSQYIDSVKRMNPFLWDKLGGALLLPVNKLKGGPPAIVKYP